MAGVVLIVKSYVYLLIHFKYIDISGGQCHVSWKTSAKSIHYVYKFVACLSFILMYVLWCQVGQTTASKLCGRLAQVTAWLTDWIPFALGVAGLRNMLVDKILLLG